MNDSIAKQAWKLRNWCRQNDIGVTTAYELIKQGKLHVVKLGRSPYVLQSESNRFFDDLKSKAA